MSPSRSSRTVWCAFVMSVQSIRCGSSDTHLGFGSESAMLADFLPVLHPYGVQVVLKVEYMRLLRLLLLVLFLDMLVEVVIPVTQFLISGLRDD